LAADENDDEMNNPIRLVVAVLTAALGSAACGAYMSPRIVPATQSPALESFRTALKTYIDETLPFRKQAAAKGDAVPNQTSTCASGCWRKRFRPRSDRPLSRAICYRPRWRL
jgi:hypothetical protein